MLTGKVGLAPGTTTLFMPYATASDLKENSNLGLIYNDKYWYTGRSWPALGDADVDLAKVVFDGPDLGAARVYVPGLIQIPAWSSSGPWYKNPTTLIGIAAIGVAGYFTYKMFLT